MPLPFNGLDLLNPDVTTSEELRAFREHYEQTKGGLLPGYEFWMAHRPGVAKRRLLTIWAADTENGRLHQARNYLAAVHYYAFLGYEDGLLYEIRHVRELGVCKGQVLDTLSFAFTHAHAHGMRAVVRAVGDYLADWDEPQVHTSVDGIFPPGWAFDPDALRSGLDFSTPELNPDEVRLLETWYLRNVGEVPAYVRFLAKYRPGLLKAHRNRYEHAIAHGLPKQMVPYMMLYFNVIRGFRDGIREAAILARTFGVTREEAVGAMCRAMTAYGGPDSLSIADSATTDILSNWD